MFHKIRWILSAVLLSATNVAFPQSYSLSPGNTILATTPFNDLYHFNILQNNLTGGFLNLNWERISESAPEGWEVFLCDNGYCYTDLPLNGTMDTVFSGDVGLMSIGVNPFFIPGTAVIKYAVWDEAFPESMDTLSWIISTEDILTVDENNLQSISIYPNPANEFISFEAQASVNFRWDLVTLQGAKIVSGNSLKKIVKFPVADIAEGMYVIVLSFENAKTVSQKILIIH